MFSHIRNSLLFYGWQARALLKVLTARRLVISDTVKARILDTANIGLLDRWLERAVTAATAEEVVADD